MKLAIISSTVLSFFSVSSVPTATAKVRRSRYGGKGSKKNRHRSDAGHSKKNLRFLEGTWYPCVIETTAFFSTGEGLFKETTNYRDTCSDEGLVEYEFLNAPEYTSYKVLASIVDRNACVEFNIDPCPDVGGIPGAALVRTTGVGTYGPAGSKLLRQTTTTLSDYEEVQNANGDWLYVDVQATTMERGTCDVVNSDDKNLYCVTEHDILKSGIVATIALSGHWVKDKKDCAACDDEDENAGENPDNDYYYFDYYSF